MTKDAIIPVELVGIEIDPTKTIEVTEGFIQDEEFSEAPEGN